MDTERLSPHHQIEQYFVVAQLYCKLRHASVLDIVSKSVLSCTLDERRLEERHPGNAPQAQLCTCTVL